MSSTQGVIVGAPRVSIKRAGSPSKRQSLRVVETKWALAFVALLLAWNHYLYQAVLLSAKHVTVSVSHGQLFEDADAPYNAMMAAAIIYVLPPIALLLTPPLRVVEPVDGWRPPGLTSCHSHLRDRVIKPSETKALELRAPTEPSVP